MLCVCACNASLPTVSLTGVTGVIDVAASQASHQATQLLAILHMS